MERLIVPAKSADVPLSQAIRVGHTVYVSGQLGTDATGRFAGDDIGSQTRQALSNMKAVLEAAGSSMGNVLKCIVLLDNRDDFGKMNAEYKTCSCFELIDCCTAPYSLQRGRISGANVLRGEPPADGCQGRDRRRGRGWTVEEQGRGQIVITHSVILRQYVDD